MARPPSASCSVTGMSRAACLLGHDFLRARELRLRPVVVEDGDVVPVFLTFDGAGVAPLVAGGDAIAFVARLHDRFVHASETSINRIAAIDGIPKDARLVGNLPLQQRSLA